ncbi:MAG: transglutaminase domain-containing protein [Parasporobacterium sp.]|nr:transglutaminase domain-containing protein [Parasporobacterium sp.]
MDRSLFLHQRASNRIMGILADVLAAVLLAASFFCCLCEQFSFSFHLSGIFQGGLSSGLVRAWNQIADVLGNTNYVILQKYEGTGEECGLFLLLTLLLLMIAAYFAVRSRFLPVLLLFVLPQVMIALLFSLYPSAGIVIFHVAAVFFSAIVMKHQEGLFPAVISAAVLALILALALIVFGTFTKGDFFRNSKESTVLKAAEDLIFGKEDLGNGDLTKRKREIREGEALQVKMSDPESLYLKGFTGYNFTGTVWEEIPNPESYQNKDMLDAIEEEGFSASGQLTQAAVLAFDEVAAGKNEMQIRNTGTDRRTAYVPYEILEEGSLSSSLKKGGSQFYAGLFGQFGSYSYTASESQTDRWTDVAGRFFTKVLNENQLTDEMEDYLRLESYYNRFVYETCADLSRSEKRLLAEFIGSAGDQTSGHISYKTAISQIRTFLEENFVYTEDLGEKRSGSRNELQEFLESGKGFDVHFATAATLLFRYFGIPARYVEGYLITPEDASRIVSGEWFSVPRERVHAWTEIYIDGIGFVPLEVTPEFYGVMNEADMETGISNNMLLKEFQQRYDREQSDETEEIEIQETEKKNDKAGKILTAILLILFGLFLLWLLWLLLSRIIKKGKEAADRRKVFLRSEPKTAVAAIYGYMEQQGLTPGEEVIALGNEAAYSRKNLSEEDRKKMLNALKQLKKEQKKVRHVVK